MTTSPSGPASTGPAGARSRGGRGPGWLLPAVTLLVGLAIGALLMWVIRPGDGSSTAGTGAAPTASPSPSEAPPDQTTGPTAAGQTATAITVPASCVELADDVDQATALLNEAATAARAGDAARLADLVRRMGQVRTTLESEANACRSAATSGGVILTTLPTAPAGG